LLRAQDAREQKRRVDENKRDHLVKYIGDDTMLHGNARYEERSEHVRRERESRQRAMEQQKLEELYREHKTREFASYNAEEDAKIASHLEKQRKEENRNQRIVQRIRGESEELRSLQEKLRTAEVNMQRKLQLDEKAMLQERDRQYAAGMDAEMEHYRQNLVAAELEKERRRREEQMGKDAVLLEQMEEKLEAQRAAKKEFEREKDVVDEIVRKIQDEDMMEMKRKKDKQEETKKYIDRFMIERENLRLENRRKEEEEESRIRAYGNQVEQRRVEQASKQAAKAEAADRVLAKMTREKEEEMRKREELEDLINRLHFEEQEKKFREQRRLRDEQQERARKEMLQANDYQMQLKAQRRQREMEEEEEYRRRMQQKFAEDERKEKEGHMRRQQKMEEFKQDVAGLASQKRAMYEQQKAVELQEYMQFQEEERQRQEIIEEERRRMLQEYAVKLMDHLPKGTLQKQSDLDMLVELLGERFARTEA